MLRCLLQSHSLWQKAMYKLVIAVSACAADGSDLRTSAQARNKIDSGRSLAMLLLGGDQAAAFMPADAQPRTRKISRVPAAPRAAASNAGELPTVVVGGGIVGLTAAYYLAQEGQPVTVVEQASIGCHASGLSGGFLADGDSGWHSGALEQIAAHSFALHEQLAEELGAEEIGYKRVRCVGRSQPGERSDTTPAWLEDGFTQLMGEESFCAQVTPSKFMSKLQAKVQSSGAEVVIAKATGVEMEDGKASALNVEHDGKQWSIPCSSLILAMGPWAKDAIAWFPSSSLPRCTVGNCYTSVTWNDAEVGKYGTMVHILGENKVEIYPREDEIYAVGSPTLMPLADDPTDIKPDQKEVDRVKAEAASAVSHLRDTEVSDFDAWFEATSDDGLPVIGTVPNTENVVISCAGGRFAFLNGPAMGQAAANIILDAAPFMNLLPFDPARFDVSKICKAQQAGVPSHLLGLAARYPAVISLVKVESDRKKTLDKLDQLYKILQKDPTVAKKLESMLGR
mmetsp:Transcript_36814/g.67905  ORF Transcript_36814/g.67905 Transcript_36814/m.67905 type:complete len:510 (-) Transcript_36814:40-1569(-)